MKPIPTPGHDRDWTQGFDQRQLKQIARMRYRQRRDVFFFRFFMMGIVVLAVMIIIEKC